MATIVLLLWAVTAGAGLRLLFTSGIGGRRPARAGAAQPAAAQPAAAQPDAAQFVDPASAPASALASAAAVGSASASGSAYVPAGAAPAPAAKPMSERAARRARYDTPTLTRNKNE